MIAASEAIEAGARRAAGTVQYVREHEAVLRELLGRDEFTQLNGLARIAQHIQDTKPPKVPKALKEVEKRESAILRWGGSIGPAFGFYQLGHALVDLSAGRPASRHVLEAAVMFGAVPITHLARAITQRIHTAPLTRPLVARAATMKPGSAELDALLRQIERRTRTAVLPAQRVESP